jgi:tetratricopeptide (TPR) repeat protein
MNFARHARWWLLPLSLAGGLAGMLATRAAAQVSPRSGEPASGELPMALRDGEIGRALEAGRWAQAESLLVAEIERSPQSSQLLPLLARVFLAQRKPLNAAIAIKKAEALGPIDDRTRFTLALAYISMNRGDWARPELERLTASDVSNTTYEYWLGRLDYDAGHFASAVRRFESVVGRDPSSVRGYDNLGLACEAVNDLERAAAAYRKAVVLNRSAAVKSAWPPLNLGILLHALGEVKEAEALLREAVSYDAQLAQAHYRLGVLLEQAERVDEATAALARAAAADAAYAEPHYALARIYRLRGRAADAQQAMATFERLHEAQRNGTGR